MATLKFDDTAAFYGSLHKALKARDDVVIDTEFTNVDDIPERLGRLLRTEQLRGSPVTGLTGVFLAGNACGAIAGPDIKSLYVLGGSLIGAGAGAFVGPVGAAIGAGIGAVVGFGAALVTEAEYQMDFEVDPQRRLRIRLQKKRTP